MNTQFITDHKSHHRSLHAFYEANFQFEKHADMAMQTTDFSICWKLKKKKEKKGQQITCVNLH